MYRYLKSNDVSATTLKPSKRHSCSPWTKTACTPILQAPVHLYMASHTSLHVALKLFKVHCIYILHLDRSASDSL